MASRPPERTASDFARRIPLRSSTPSPSPSVDAAPLESFFRSLDRGTSINFFGVQPAARGDSPQIQSPSLPGGNLSGSNSFSADKSPSPPPDEDADFTPDGAQALLNAFLDRYTVNITWLSRPALRECLSSTTFAGDPRYVGLYRHPLFLAAAHWIGARMLLDGGTSPLDRTFSHSLPLGTLLPRLEKIFVRVLRRELSRFWAEASTVSNSAAGPELLQNLDNLALLLTLAVTTGFFVIVISRFHGSRVLIRLLIAIFRRTRIPGEAGLTRPSIEGVDDLLIWHTWLDVFWITRSMEILTATTGGHVLAYDPASEFPTVPFVMGAAVLASIPRPSTRPINGPIPFDTIPLEEPYKCREYLGWTNPILANPVDDETRDGVIAKAFVAMEQAGTFHLGSFIFELMAHSEAFTRWLKEEAGLTLLAVLVAEQRLENGLSSPTSTSPVSSDGDYVSTVLRNPFLGEAIRRRRHLWTSATVIESRLPTELRDAAREADVATVLRLLSVLPGASGQQILTFLLILRQTMMLLVSPEPFKDLVGDEYSSSGHSISDDSSMISSDTTETGSSEDAEDALLEEWFTSPSFLEASRNALLISRTMRKLTDYISKSQSFKANYTIFAFGCITASHAAWFHLLVLRRFRNLVAGAPEAERARALDLYDDMVADIQSCLKFIDASGQPQYAATRNLLNEILEGQSTKLDREQVQMLRMAQQAVHFCEHMEGAVLDGHCFLCAAERAKARMGDSADLSAGGSTLDGASAGLSAASLGPQDPIADLPELAMLGNLRLGRRVRFAATVEVQETYSKEEYPGRSMMAKEEDDDEADEEEEEDEQVGTGKNGQKHDFSMPLTTLHKILQQRDGDKLMPNLTSYWGERSTGVDA